MKSFESDAASNPNEPNDLYCSVGCTGESNSRQKRCYEYPLDYLLLIKRNPRYRLYLISHLCQHVGDWYIRIASLLLVERLAPNSATAVSIVIIVKMIPQVTMTHIGGALADSFDRRKLMILLDTLGAFTTLLFLVAIRSENLILFYIVTALRATVHSIYEPITKSIVPMIASDSKEDLKKANTLNGLAWSFMVLVGGVVAGRSSAHFGVQICYREFVCCVIICEPKSADFSLELHLFIIILSFRQHNISNKCHCPLFSQGGVQGC